MKKLACLLVAVAGCGAEAAPGRVALPIPPGSVALAFDSRAPAEPGERGYIIGQVGRTEWDAIRIDGGTALRVMDDPGGARVSVVVMEGPSEGRAAVVARGDVRITPGPVPSSPRP